MDFKSDNGLIERKNCSLQYAAYVSTSCDVTVAIHQGNETFACPTERDLARLFTVVFMQDLKRQYEELMDRLEFLKTKSRHRSTRHKQTPSNVASTSRPTSDSEDKESVARPASQTPFERIGNAVFDIEFLERCQQCLLMQRTGRQRGACNEARIKELAGLYHVVSAVFTHNAVFRNGNTVAELPPRIHFTNENIRGHLLKTIQKSKSM